LTYYKSFRDSQVTTTAIPDPIYLFSKEKFSVKISIKCELRYYAKALRVIAQRQHSY